MIARSVGVCPGTGPSLSQRTFAARDRFRETQALYAPIEAALTAGDCEGARARAVDAGRHELAARIRRACRAAAS